MAALETLPRGVAAPMFDIRLDIVDETIPALRTVARAAPQRFAWANEVASRKIKEEIQKAFLSGQQRWTPLSPETIRKKRAWGIPWPSWILHETLTLHRNVMNMRVEARAVGSKKMGGHLLITIPKQSFWSSPYVKFHEEGTKRIPRRSFIRNGIEAARGEVADVYADATGSLIQTVREPKSAMIMPQKYTREEMALRSRLGLRGWLFVFAPPTGLWALFGASADLRGFIRGDFNSAAIRGFLRQWMMGYAQLTEKMWRRKIRRVVWS